MSNIYKSIEEYNQNKKWKCQSYMMIWLLICLVIKRPHPIITELFVSGRKVNILLVFVTQLYFAFPKTVRLNSTNYFVAKIPN